MLVSVLIPAYNVQATIVAAARSVLCQTFEGEVELIIYDDGSTDGTVAEVERAFPADARLRIMRADENGGASRARNRLLDAARGEWIAYLDADDVFVPDKLVICLHAAEVHGCDWVSHDFGYLRADGQIIGRIRDIESLQATVLRRALIGDLRFPETLPAGEDSQFFGLLSRTAQPLHLPNVLTGLTIRSGSLTDKYWFQKRLVELWHDAHKDAPPPADFAGYLGFYHDLPWAKRLNYLRKWRGQKFGRLAAGAVLSGHYFRAARYLACSVVLDRHYVISRARRNLTT